MSVCMRSSSSLRDSSILGSVSGHESGTAKCPGRLCTQRVLPVVAAPSCATWVGVTPPSSLLRAHAPGQNPPADFGLPTTEGLCRLSPVPAGSWPFPALSPQSLYGCLDPYPAAPSRCVCSFLPLRRRPHLRLNKFGTLNTPRNATSTRLHSFEAAVIPLCSGSHTC